MIKGIVCVDKNWGIGKVNKETGVGQLLFNIPADLKYFKEKTNHNIVVMGKATYDSLPKRPLPNRINIVLWDKAPLTVETKDGVIFFNNFDALLSFIKILSKEYDVFICGGASVYKLFLPYYDEVLVTKVDAEDKEATVFFPNLVKNGYKKAEAESYYKDESTNGYFISKQLWVRQVEESEMSL
jgi:dihydrofolate reductase